MSKDEKILKRNEELIIKQKAEYIADHSLTILEHINDEKILEDFTFFLLSDKEMEFSKIPENINPKDYYSSLSVIFKVCENLNKLGFNKEQQKNLRNKLRIYTKYFKENEVNLLKVSDFICLNIDQLNNVFQNEEKTKIKM